jgi:hypothetical protein
MAKLKPMKMFSSSFFYVVKKNLKPFLLLPLLLLSYTLHGTELLPWFSRDLIIPLQATYTYQTYPYLHSPKGHFGKRARDHFLNLSASLAYENLSAEIEFLFADTRKQHTTLDCARLAGRYRVLNDIVGDPLSLVVGATITKAFSHSLKDPSSFHHGRIEAELHVAFGRETPVEALWWSRWWGVAGIGIGDHGSPWLHGDIAIEKNWCDRHQVRLFVNTLWGLGNDNLQPGHRFHGYGPLRHRSIDLGLRYSYVFESGWIISAGYAHRIYARNFPAHANLYTISLLYPWFSETVVNLLWKLSNRGDETKCDP